MALTFDLLLMLFAIGVLGGAISAVAGGAGFFTFPALIWCGLPPIMANATNFIALTPSNIAALPAYRAELRTLAWALAGPVALAAVGGTCGTVLVLVLGASVFEGAVPYLMGAATFLFAVAGHVRDWIERVGIGNWFPAVLLFLLSVYGGYFGAGIGQVTLAALMMIGLKEFNQANAAKNLVLVAMSIIPFLIYCLSGLVSWPHAAVMIAGTVIGGYFGGILAQVVSPMVLRWGIIAFGVFLTLYYFIVG